jgi:4a-hydroxytetrahydrobiopterin dehydratase
MAQLPRLTEAELNAALHALDGWQLRGGKLHREYQFEDFVHAFGFMATSAIAVEAMNHHPEWSNVWNKVVVDLTTHDSGGVTVKDVELAHKLEAIARRLYS